MLFRASRAFGCGFADIGIGSASSLLGRASDPKVLCSFVDPWFCAALGFGVSKRFSTLSMMRVQLVLELGLHRIHDICASWRCRAFTMYTGSR